MDDQNDAFAAAKLRDYITGEVKENNDLYPHTGLVQPGSEASDILSFVESLYDSTEYDVPASFVESKAGAIVRKAAATDRVGSSVNDLSSFAVGLTDTDVDISQAQAYAKIGRSIVNEKAPYSGVLFGGMNKGKTAFAGLWLELWRELIPLKYGTEEYVVLSNMPTLESADHVVTDIDQFRRLAFGDVEYVDTGGEKGTPPEIDPAIPKWWHFDECSTHLNASTRGYEVQNLYLPLLKRFAKVNMDAVHLGHSGMDIHADMRRDTITTEFVFKTGVTTANVYRSMFEDQGADLKYVLEEVPDTSIAYDPDDYSPFAWE